MLKCWDHLNAVTWKATCTYSQFLSQKTPTCCVSLSSFYNDTIVNCPACTCGCPNNHTRPGSCVEGNSRYLASVINGPGKSSFTPLVQCTSHMCPIRVHWHVKLNYREYWRAKISVTNFNYRMNYTQWNLVMQHPNFNNLTQIFSFNYKALTPYGTISKLPLQYPPCAIAYLADLIGKVGTRHAIGCMQASGKPSLSMMVLSVSGYEAPNFLNNRVFWIWSADDTAMMWGLKFYNDLLMVAGPMGNVQSELLFRKDPLAFTFGQGWAFPRRVYFNGENCVMPPPDAYPWLPNATPLSKSPLIVSIIIFWTVLAGFLVYV